MGLQFNGNISGSLEITGPAIITSLDSFPSGSTGMLAVSSSDGGVTHKLYFYNGVTWMEVAFT